MKKSNLKKLYLLLLVAVFAVFASMTTFAAVKAPTLAKTVKVETAILPAVHPNGKSVRFSHITYNVTLPIKNLSQNATLVGADEDGTLYTDDYTVELYKNGSKIDAYIAAFPSTYYGKKYPISFKIKQNNKIYTLRTTLKPFYYTPYKTVKLNGKKVSLSPVTKGKIPTFARPKDGKLKTIKTSLTKNYKQMAVYIYRIKNGNFTSYKYKKNFVLKKGDVIVLEFLKKGWRKADAQMVLVK